MHYSVVTTAQTGPLQWYEQTGALWSCVSWVQSPVSLCLVVNQCSSPLILGSSFSSTREPGPEYQLGHTQQLKKLDEEILINIIKHQGSGLVEFVSEEEELQQRRVAHLPIDINITTFYLFWVTNWELEYHQGNTVQQKCDNILIKSTWRRSY